MVPPAALCVHLCIGQAYAFSVFNLPMTKLIGISQSAPGDWKLTELGWIFSIAIFFLGVSSAIFGRWVEEGGPRRAMFTAALCWAGGFFISAIGVYIHTLWLIYLGYGVLGGIALGIGYISPVSTLIKWFPDRPGMATGMAIMGFGGGAFHSLAAFGVVDAPLQHSDPCGAIAETFIVLGAVYFIWMLAGSLIVRVPAPEWKPEGYTPPAQALKLITRNDVFVYDSLKTPQFWLIWWILCLNVNSGHRRARTSFSHESGNVPGPCQSDRGGGFRRLDEPVQHGRPLLLGVYVGLYRPQEHLFRVHVARFRSVLPHPLFGDSG